jgi:hypothetical protein
VIAADIIPVFRVFTHLILPVTSRTGSRSRLCQVAWINQMCRFVSDYDGEIHNALANMCQQSTGRQPPRPSLSTISIARKKTFFLLWEIGSTGKRRQSLFSGNFCYLNYLTSVI